MALKVGLACLLGLGAPAAAGSKSEEPVTCVHLAWSWDDAVSEARTLALPIVVHSHGFYCGPCWGMHASVMCNDKYIEFAEDTTVEVISLSRLDEGVEKKDRRAQTYEAEEGGQPVEYLVEFPGMTVERMLALSRSKAGSYNNTGGVPYTCVVDPFTLEEIKAWPGGGHSAKSLIEEIQVIAKDLQKEHGIALRRKDLRKYESEEGESLDDMRAGDFAKAIKRLEKAARKSDAWPAELQARVAASRSAILGAATEALEAVERTAESDVKTARKDLQRLRSRLKGTGLEDRATDLDAHLRELVAAK